MMKMKKTGILSICMVALMMFIVSNVAEGAVWERISEYEDTTIYVDNESIRHIPETIVKAQYKIVFKEPSWVKSKAINNYLLDQENNCSGDRYKVYQVTVHFNDGTNDTFSREEEHGVPSDTFQSVIHAFMCKKTK
jgi:hypothetical protein